MSDYKTTVKRLSERGSTDRSLIDSILDEALFCHVGFIDEGLPYVIPTIHARAGDTVYFHGSPASRMLRGMKQGMPVCITVTLLDGLVVARTPFHQSMNYRSVILFGEPRSVDDPAEKLAALQAVTDHVTPGRWTDSRPPSDKEIAATLVAALTIDAASAKVRTGPPVDDAADMDLPYWAGVVPIALTRSDPINDPHTEGPPPSYLRSPDSGA